MKLTRKVVSPHLILGAMTCALVCCAPACSDPPHEGQLVIDLDRNAIRPDVTNMGFTVTQLLVFYGQPPPAPAHKDVSCNSGPQTVVSVPPASVSIDLTHTGRTFVGAANVPAGNIREIWMSLSGPSVIENGLLRPLHTSLNCDDEANSGAAPSMDTEDGGDEPDDDLGVLRLTSSDPAGITVTEGQPTEIAIQFDADADITHTHGNESNPGHGNGNPSDAPDANGDLHGGRWALAAAVPFVHVPPESGSSIVPGEVVVRFKSGTSQADMNAAIAKESATVLRAWQPTNYFVLQLQNGADEKSIIEDLYGMDNVQYVLPNTFVGPLQEDPDFPRQVQWPQVGLNEKADGSPDPTSGWGINVGSSTTVVAVLDTGLDFSNPDLIPNTFINVNEIPQWVIDIVSPLHGGTGTWKDLDLNNDGIVSFDELDALNAMTNGEVCPLTHAPLDRCNPLDLVSGAGVEDADHSRCQATPVRGFGWEDGVDHDCNGFVDDVVGWNFDSDNNLPNDEPLPGEPDGVFHGSTVASIIGAQGGNGILTSGINWHVSILPVKQKILPPGTTGIPKFYRDSVYMSFKYAASMRADVVNASFGGYVTLDGADDNGCHNDPSALGIWNLSQDKFSQTTNEFNMELDDMYSDLGRALIVFAAGNCGLDHEAPGIFVWPARQQSNTLIVASVGAAGTQNVDELSVFSDRGLNTIDLAAPGEFFVASTGGTGVTDCLSEQPFEGCAGTSFAAPMVAGAAALAISSDSSLEGNPCAVADRLLRNADHPAHLVGINGSRRLNVQRALQNVIAQPVRSCP